jgi:PmbA protein
MDIDAVKKNLLEIAARVVADAIGAGAGQAEAGLSHDEGLNVAVRMGELESVERQQDRGLAITVYRQGAKGSASTSDFSAKGIAATVEKALSIARFTNSDVHAGLADARDMADSPPDLDLMHEWPLGVAEAEKIALEAETAARDADSRIANSEGASVSTSNGLQVYANSHGFSGAYASSSHSLSTSVIAKSNGSLERDYWYTAARSPGDLESAEAVGRRAAERALRRLDSRQLSTRVVPVLFAADIARSLFGHLLACLSGTSQYRKASFLLDCAGRQIFPSHLNIVE